MTEQLNLLSVLHMNLRGRVVQAWVWRSEAEYIHNSEQLFFWLGQHLYMELASQSFVCGYLENIYAP